MLTQEILKSLLQYDPISGLFTNKTTRSYKALAGKESGYICSNHGYVIIKIKNKAYKAHRLAFLYMTGNFPLEFVDHINGIRSDNRWINLREATNQQNIRNTRVRKNTKSGFKGVLWDYRWKKWVAYCQANGKRHFLGSSSTPEGAYKYAMRVKCCFGNCHFNLLSNDATNG